MFTSNSTQHTNIPMLLPISNWLIRLTCCILYYYYQVFHSVGHSEAPSSAEPRWNFYHASRSPLTSPHSCLALTGWFASFMRLQLLNGNLTLGSSLKRRGICMQTALEHTALNLTPVVPALMTILYGAALLWPFAVLIEREPTPGPPPHPSNWNSIHKASAVSQNIYFLKHKNPLNFPVSEFSVRLRLPPCRVGMAGVAQDHLELNWTGLIHVPAEQLRKILHLCLPNALARFTEEIWT